MYTSKVKPLCDDLLSINRNKGQSDKMHQTHEETISWTKCSDLKSAPNVQEMVRINSHSVPHRYIQRNEEDDSTVSREIPYINMALLVSGDEEERQKLHYACKDLGFFQLINHGIAERVLHSIMAVEADFFKLPLLEKLKYAKGKNEFEGYGQGYVFDDEQKIDWNDLMFIITAPTQHRNMNLWPTEVPNFLNAVDEYSKEVEKLSIEILANLSVLMGLERNGLSDMHLKLTQGMAMHYYPPCARPDLVYGISPHSDASSITFLLQDDNVTGLEMKYKGEWVPVTPVPSAFVVNIGDSLDAWSNGMYKSIDHRAVTNKKRARISVATFVLPQEEAIIGPVETMVNDSHPRMYKNTKYGDYIRHTLSHKLEGKANIECLKL